MFIIEPADESRWRSETLDLPFPPPAHFRVLDRLHAAFLSDRGSRLWPVAPNDWKFDGPRTLSPPAQSGVTLFRDSLLVPARDPRFGGWGTFVTADRTIEIRSLDPAQDDIHGVALAGTKSKRPEAMWSPLVHRTGGIHGGVDSLFVSHPDGAVWRIGLQLTNEIAHLSVTHSRQDLPPLAAPAMLLTAADGTGQHLVLVTGDGACMVLDPTTLRTVASWQVRGNIRDAATDSRRLFLCLDGARFQAVEDRQGQIASTWERTLDGRGWRLAGCADGYLVAFEPSGQVIALDSTSGQTLWTHQAPTALALPPCIVGGDLALATIDGGLVFVAGPSRSGDVEGD
jgi:hypothetical protein